MDIETPQSQTYHYVNWNQMSDRVNPHSMKFQNHPSQRNGNSTVGFKQSYFNQY